MPELETDPAEENARLRARVAELERRLAAKPPTDLAGLRRMMDAAPWGILVIERSGVIGFANREMGRWLKVPPPAVGSRLTEAVTAPFLALLRPLLEPALSGESTEIDVEMRDAAGEARSFRLEVTPRTGGPEGVTGCVVSLYDNTENRALDRTIRENEAHLARVNAISPSALYIYDIDLGYVIWIGGRGGRGLNDPRTDLADNQPTALNPAVIAEEFLPVLYARLNDLRRCRDNEVVEAEYQVKRKDGSRAWVLDRGVVFERDHAGRVTKILCASVNIDERKRAEERRILLLNELNHRVKNTLASVQLIARQSLRPGRSIGEMAEAFNTRLLALSESHNILTHENWEGAGLRKVVDGALRPFRSKADGRIETSGSNVRLPPRAVLGLSMALHELATNAAKYGALSGDHGKVAISWKVRRGEVDRLYVEWVETGGPPVSPPTSPGFGVRLLTRGLTHEMNCSVDLEFEHAGVVCRLAIPMEAAT